MPTYDYRCDACAHAFEAFQQMTADHLTDCPECGASALVRLLGSGAGIIFKGSGFYETDYKRTKTAGNRKQEGGGEAGTGSASDASRAGEGGGAASGAGSSESGSGSSASASSSGSASTDD